jgi:hypothetical protein
MTQATKATGYNVESWVTTIESKLADIGILTVQETVAMTTWGDCSPRLTRLLKYPPLFVEFHSPPSFPEQHKTEKSSFLKFSVVTPFSLQQH